MYMVAVTLITFISLQVTSAGLVVAFDLLDRQLTDPYNVLGLQDTIAVLIGQLNSNTFEVEYIIIKPWSSMINFVLLQT